MPATINGPRWDTLERVERAVEKVRDRLQRAVRALEQSGIDYAVLGGHAVAAWVAQVDEGAVRNTPDVDILLRKEDLSLARAALARVGFVHHRVRGWDVFLDGPDAPERDSVHIVFAGERLSNELAPYPDIGDSQRGPEFKVVSLEALVGTKLSAWRLKDRMHLQDLWEVGLIDESWVGRFPGELGQRLENLLDTAEENCSLSYRTRELED